MFDITHKKITLVIIDNKKKLAFVTHLTLISFNDCFCPSAVSAGTDVACSAGLHRTREKEDLLGSEKGQSEP